MKIYNKNQTDNFVNNFHSFNRMNDFIHNYNTFIKQIINEFLPSDIEQNNIKYVINYSNFIKQFGETYRFKISYIPINNVNGKCKIKEHTFIHKTIDFMFTKELENDIELMITEIKNIQLEINKELFLYRINKNSI